MPDAPSLGTVAWDAERKRGPHNCNGGSLFSLHPGLAPGCCRPAALGECVLAVYRVHATPSVSAHTAVPTGCAWAGIDSLNLTPGRPPPPNAVETASSTSKSSVNVAAIVVPVVVGMLLIVAACYAIRARWFRTGKVCADA